MNELKKKIKGNTNLLILSIACIVYFCFLLQYYSISYYVPDFRNYFYFALQGEKARDGFSSLFLWIAGWIPLLPKPLTISCLCMLTLSIFMLLYFYKNVLCKENTSFYIGMFVVFSCGIWYYIYGKLFYDFPFTAFSYGICLLILQKVIQKKRNKQNYQLSCYGFYLVLGFLLSWKPYNIFVVAGIGLLIFCKEEIRNIIFESIYSIKKLVISFFSVCFGYLIGNYNLIFDWKATLNGIKAYPAKYNFFDFLFHKDGMIWDHINNMPFCLSVMNIISVLLLFFIIPILTKKYRYLFVSIFMWGCFWFYISFFSPGYTWHGFSFGLFLITYVLFFISELEFLNRVNKLLINIAILCQCFVCFFIYFPIQNRWFTITEEAIYILEEKEDEISAQVLEIVNLLDGEAFTIDVAVKRYQILPFAPLEWNEINKNNTYLVANNYGFYTPLESKDFWEWKEIKNRYNYSDDNQIYQYIIYIIPDCMKKMSDVAIINWYEKNELVEQVNGKGYGIYVYRRKDGQVVFH